MGLQYHEVFKICQANNLDPFDFAKGFLHVVNSDLPDLQITALEHIDVSLNILNKYFKNEVIGELWVMEKFSIKEA
jgi:hypothetical protein